MNDNEIIKALEYCKDKGCCPECPYYSCGASCIIEYDSLDLINRLQAEIKMLQNDISFLDKHNDELIEDNDKLKAEIERLKGIIGKDILISNVRGCGKTEAVKAKIHLRMGEVKKQARREFAERLISDYHEKWKHGEGDWKSGLADHLIANGVICPPCKVGDTVYELKENGKIVKGIVQSIHQNLVGKEQGRWIVTSWFDDYYADSKTAGFECGTHLYSAFDDFGKTVFLSREDAERALKEVQK